MPEAMSQAKMMNILFVLVLAVVGVLGQKCVNFGSEFDGPEGANLTTEPTWENWYGASGPDVLLSGRGTLLVEADDDLVNLIRVTGGMVQMDIRFQILGDGQAYIKAFTQYGPAAGTVWDLQILPKVGVRIGESFKDHDTTVLLAPSDQRPIIAANQWYDLSHVVDLDAGTQTLSLDGNEFAQGTWSGNTFAAIDLYGVPWTSATTEYDFVRLIHSGTDSCIGAGPSLSMFDQRCGSI